MGTADHSREHTQPAGRLAALVLAAAQAIALPLGAAVIDVGSSPPGACEAPGILEALAMAAATTASDEIRLRVDTTYVLEDPLHLTDWNATAKGALTIAGGFSDCADTTPDDASPSGLELDTGNAPVVTVDATGAAGSLVTLRRIKVPQPSSWSARALVVTANGTLNLQRCTVFRFPAGGGGGIDVSGGGALTLDRYSRIHSHGGPTTDGGGLRCVGADSSAYVDGDVESNTGRNGGGIYVANGCELSLGPNATVEYNDATLGGGVAAGDGAVVGSTGAIIGSNTATSSGGGLYVEGNSTQVRLLRTAVASNAAGFAGGGLYVTAGAAVELDGSGSCAGGTTCKSYLVDNSLDPGAQHGAAAQVVNAATLTLYQTLVGRNRIDEAEPYGSVFFVAAGGELRTESAEVSFNRGVDVVFQAESGGFVQVAFSTVAYNWCEGTGGEIVEARGVKMTGSGTSGRINTSIFYPTAGYSVSGGAAWAQVDCLITQTVSGLGGGFAVVVANPLYNSVPLGDLRVSTLSPAVDFCDTFAYAPTQSDLEGRLRGHDVPTNPDGSPGVSGGRQDAGAYELWELFIDGFETGTTSRWSGKTP
jgi:hypothetical protein